MHQSSHHQAFTVPPTCLKDRHGLLLDTGAIVNLHSDFWRRRYQPTITKMGLKSLEKRKLASFSGIGGKTTISQKQCKIPICVDGQKGSFTSQELKNSEIPAIVGLNGIEAQQMMLIPHDEKVIIPNGGKVRISVSKEVKIVKCIRTPSGHLLLPCDEWTKKSTNTRSLTLLAGE